MDMTPVFEKQSCKYGSFILEEPRAPCSHEKSPKSIILDGKGNNENHHLMLLVHQTLKGWL
jgi:hypothetical protein